MTFLQHFLPGQPVEENGHVSLGVLTNARLETDAAIINMGFDIELSDVYLRETQNGPTQGSDFLRETRPEGVHYNYDVRGNSAAAYVQSEFRVSDKVTISGGVRGEYVRSLTLSERDDQWCRRFQCAIPMPTVYACSSRRFRQQSHSPELVTPSDQEGRRKGIRNLVASIGFQRMTDTTTQREQAGRAKHQQAAGQFHRIHYRTAVEMKPIHRRPPACKQPSRD